jgi:hypothetical protein
LVGDKEALERTYNTIAEEIIISHKVISYRLRKGEIYVVFQPIKHIKFLSTN